jgi:DENN (AEX-3) domain
MSNPNSRSSKSQDLSESGSFSFRRPSDSRRSAQTLESNMDSTARLRGRSGLDDGDDEDDNAGNDDGLFLGFEHCMNTDERRKMRELERAELEERRTRTRSSSPTEPSSSFRSRFGTKSTGTSLSSRYTRTSNTQDDDASSKKSTSRRTIYSRELDKRDRQRDEKSLRSADDRSQRSDDTRRNAGMDSFPPSTRSRESLRRNDDNDVDSRKSTDAGYRIREELLLKSSRRREGERSGTHRSDRPRERSITRSDETKPSYRSKSSDFDEDAIERRRRREARQRRYEIEAEERRKRDSQNLPSDGRAIEDEDEERRRRRKLRLEERRLVGGVGGVGESNTEERRRRLEERRHDDERRRRNDERKHITPVDSLEEDRRRRHEERKLREERRLARRSGENPTNANTAETSLNLDDDQVSRRNRTLENRRKQSDAQQEDSQSISTDRLRQINDSDRQSRLGSGYGRRARSSDPDMRNIAESENTAWSIGLKGEKKMNDSLPTSLNRAVPDLERNVSVRTSSRSELFLNKNPIPPQRQESMSGALQRKAVTLNSRGAENSSSESETEEEYEVHELSASENDEKWTIRISLISAVDLPFNVVPNIPLCPILKFGLIRSSEIENFELFSNTDATKNSTKSSIFEKIEKEGILSIPNSRVRCTSSKILSKRDNGSMDFHEEMRWDDVTRPSQILLAVELCARAAYPPPNMFEGPLAKVETPLTLSSTDVPLLGISEASDDHTSIPVRNFRPSGIGLSSTSKSVDYDDIFQCAIGKKPSEEINSSPRRTIAEDGSQSGIGTFGFMGRKKQEPEKEEASESNNQLPSGIASMHLLWKKGRQQFETRQATKQKSSPEGRDIVTPAASIGKFLIGVKDETRKKSTTSLQEEHEGEPTQRDTDPNPRRDVFRMTTSSTTDSASLGSSNLSTKRPFPQERMIRAGEENVALQTLKKKRKIEMAQDMRLGSLVIPLSKLSLEKAFDRKGAARIEQWYQLDSTNNSVIPVHNPTRRGLTTASKLAARRNPSVLLEISFSAPEVLDLSEDELEVDSDSEKNDEKATDESMLNNDAANSNISFSRRTSVSIRKLNKVTETNDVPEKSANLKKAFDDDPYLSSGICDFVAVVGASNIGDQSQDNGAKGWVNSNPECAILEQFPPNDDFHLKNKRFVTLQNKSEWFCFPEGCRLWRGAEPPSHTDLNLKRFSASSPGGAASSIAAFDACLNCTTSFSWFVIQSNEKENDFKNTRTYGAVIKFYAPAPPGIDSTQDDFAQGMRTSSDLGKRIPSQAKRLWVPLGILLTSNLPIVGVMEAMLLRLCEALASKTGGAIHSTSYKRIQQIIHQDLANLIINYQKPIPGVLHCSIPFLSGERLHVTVPPPTGLPPLPHGASVTSVCRLLGSEGLNFLLAAALTESKILIHSDEIANLPMVAEVATALIYPFIWALPYLPVLPESMLEFVEAPLSYFIGIPSCKMCEIDDDVLADIVVIDLDNGFTPSEHYDGR